MPGGIIFPVPRSVDLERAWPAVAEYLGGSPQTTARPVLVMLSGLPGTGKSYLAHRLATKMPLVIVEGDRVRKTLFPKPAYTAEESKTVHRTGHHLVAFFLEQGRNVLYDATNLIEFHRELVYRIAEGKGAKLVVVKTVASPEVVEKRLTQNSGRGSSEANWEVYLELAKNEEPIARPHLVVDTTKDADQALAKVLREIKRV